jgi:D-glycero-D-manno-heptose 1,7-bisphosphate phosphatase
MTKCVFLDRDGVINKDYVDYVYDLKKFEFLREVPEALRILKEEGYLLLMMTNQSGVVKGIFSDDDVQLVYGHIQEASAHAFSEMYYSPYHDNWSRSFSRKPDTLMWEKAIAKYDIDVSQSWMIGDKESDMIPANKLGINGAIVANQSDLADKSFADLRAFVQWLCKK